MMCWIVSTMPRVSLARGDRPHHWRLPGHGPGNHRCYRADIFTRQSESGFATTRLPHPGHRTIPIGLDVEVVSFASLERAWKEADQPFHREHVMPFFLRGLPARRRPARRAPRPTCGLPTRHSLSIRKRRKHGNVLRGTSLRGFKVAVLNHQPDYGSLRWTVDTAADLALVREIFNHFPGREHFPWQDILALFEREPDLGRINADVRTRIPRE